MLPVKSIGYKPYKTARLAITASKCYKNLATYKLQSAARGTLRNQTRGKVMASFRTQSEDISEGLKIFLRATGKQPKWYAVINHDGKEHTRTTGKAETKKAEAIIRAKEIYRELTERLETGRSTYKVTFSDAATDYLGSLKAGKGYRDAERVIQKHLLPAFGKLDIAKVSDLDISRYQAKRAKQGLKGSTYNTEMSVLRQVFHHVVPDHMDASKVPTIKNTSLNGQATRPAFETFEIAMILRHLWKRYRTATPKHKASAFNLYAYVTLLAATGARPISLRNVRVGSVQRHRGGYTMLMQSAKGYGKKGKVVPQRWAKRVLKQLLAKHDGSKPDDYLFMQFGEDYYIKEFRKVIVRLGIKDSPTGESRSIYSVRHHYITEMVIKGVPMEVTAKNTLTSIQMIAKHYDKSDSLQFFDLLH